MVILPSKNNYNKNIADKIVSIISSQAVSIGRFNVIDRNIVEEILTEQKFQLSGIVNNDQVIEIGNLASAEEALVLDVIHFNQKGVPKEKDSEDKLFEDNMVRILVDKKSLLYLVGTTLDYSGGLNGKGFVFKNPNANRTCGCGESFSL